MVSTVSLSAQDGSVPLLLAACQSEALVASTSSVSTCGVSICDQLTNAVAGCVPGAGCAESGLLVLANKYFPIIRELTMG